MRYAQIKSGGKLHLILESEGYLSNPICGIKAQHYRMTINVPLGHACLRCQTIMQANNGQKERVRFYSSFIKESAHAGA